MQNERETSSQQAEVEMELLEKVLNTTKKENEETEK